MIGLSKLELENPARTQLAEETRPGHFISGVIILVYDPHTDSKHVCTEELVTESSFDVNLPRTGVCPMTPS